MRAASVAAVCSSPWGPAQRWPPKLWTPQRWTCPNECRSIAVSECVCCVLPRCGKAQRAGILLSALLPKALLLNATQQRGVSWPPPTQHGCGRAIRCHGRSCGSCGSCGRRRNQMPCSSPLQRSAHTRSAAARASKVLARDRPRKVCARLGAPKVISVTTPRLRHSSKCVVFFEHDYRAQSMHYGVSGIPQ